MTPFFKPSSQNISVNEEKGKRDTTHIIAQ